MTGPPIRSPMRNPLDPSEGRHPALVIRPVWAPGSEPRARIEATGQALLPAWERVFTYDDSIRLVGVSERSATTSVEYRRAAYHYRDGRLDEIAVESRSEADESWDRQIIVHEYDARGHLLCRMTRETGQDNTCTRILYVLDVTGRRIGAQLCADDGSIVHEDRFQFDAHGRLSHQIHQAAGQAHWTIDYSYRTEDDPTLHAETHSRDGITSYEYDRNGRLIGRTRRTRGDDRVALRVRFTYDSAGRLSTEDIERDEGPERGRTRYSYRYDP